MPGIARKDTDAAGGKDIVGSPDVFVENKPAVRIGDAIQAHGRPPHANPVMAFGSPSVFVNNIAVCRTGDKANCGHPTSGSGTVFADS
jgi:uncharacterized Zn-binding protein involved in type VI secretion